MHAYSQIICGSMHGHPSQSCDINKSLETVIKYTVTITEHDMMEVWINYCTLQIVRGGKDSRL